MVIFESEGLRGFELAFFPAEAFSDLLCSHGVAGTFYPGVGPEIYQWFQERKMADKKKTEARKERPVSEEALLKVTKEVVVKFIEVGRLSPANFSEVFAEVHRVVRDTAGVSE